jgi:hypothetical protein
LASNIPVKVTPYWLTQEQQENDRSCRITAAKYVASVYQRKQSRISTACYFANKCDSPAHAAAQDLIEKLTLLQVLSMLQLLVEVIEARPLLSAGP